MVTESTRRALFPPLNVHLAANIHTTDMDDQGGEWQDVHNRRRKKGIPIVLRPFHDCDLHTIPPTHSTGNPEFAIKQALTLATKTGGVPNSFPTLDWQLHKVIVVRKRVQHRFLRMHSDEDINNLRKATAVVQRRCIRLRRQQWDSTCKTLDENAGLGKFWRIANKLMRVRTPRQPFTGLALALGNSIYL